jgi:hypothetical protein
VLPQEDYDYNSNTVYNEAGLDGTWRAALMP